LSLGILWRFWITVEYRTALNEFSVSFSFITFFLFLAEFLLLVAWRVVLCLSTLYDCDVWKKIGTIPSSCVFWQVQFYNIAGSTKFDVFLLLLFSFSVNDSSIFQSFLPLFVFSFAFHDSWSRFSAGEKKKKKRMFRIMWYVDVFECVWRGEMWTVVDVHGCVGCVDDLCI